MAHHFHPSILREYDIRGLVGETIDENDAEIIGRVFGSLIVRNQGHVVCVGYDGRLSSPNLEASLVFGLKTTGIEVHRIGLGPTPMLYYATHTTNADGGIMVTGSHNPSNHNGFKMVLNGESFFADQIKELGRMAESGNWESNDNGTSINIDVLNSYVDRLLIDYNGIRDLTVVWDAGNGATCDVMRACTNKLPGRHILLNDVIDGRFPSHHPDPSESKNLTQIIEAVIKKGADLGIAFDGDGDRIGIVDGMGQILHGDQIMMLLAEEVLHKHKDAIVLADVKSSQILFDHITKLGGRPMMCRTGHSLIKKKMIETGALLAGEMSGHIFFADRYYGYDDALYTAIRFLSMVSKYKSLTDHFNSLPHLFNTPELRITCSDERKFDVITEVKKRLIISKANISDIDGVRVNTPYGWWLLRASNTQAALVARCESTSKEGMLRLKDILIYQLAESGLKIKL